MAGQNSHTTLNQPHAYHGPTPMSVPMAFHDASFQQHPTAPTLHLMNLKGGGGGGGHGGHGGSAGAAGPGGRGTHGTKG